MIPVWICSWYPCVADVRRSPAQDIREEEAEELVAGSPTDHEFISDSFQNDHLNEEEIKKEMQQLGMSDNEKDDSE